jgi:hypothetical protein
MGIPIEGMDPGDVEYPDVEFPGLDELITGSTRD